MIGAIIGDIIGSRFERHNTKSKEFELFTTDCRPTDDSIMTIAVMEALLDSAKEFDLAPNAIFSMQRLGHNYISCGFGRAFHKWILSKHPRPYGSYGNGAAMRISPVGFYSKTLTDVHMMSYEITSVSHNHPEAYKGAEAIAVAIFLATNGRSKDYIKNYISSFYYPMNFTIDEIRERYAFDASCQGSVPQALEAFFESTDFEDAIRNAISIGGDSDTIAAMCGGIADAYYGIPDDILNQAREYLNPDLKDIIDRFEAAL